MWDEDSFYTGSFSSDSWLFGTSTVVRRRVGSVFIVGEVARISVVQLNDVVRLAGYR